MMIYKMIYYKMIYKMIYKMRYKMIYKMIYDVFQNCPILKVTQFEPAALGMGHMPKMMVDMA